MPHALAIVFAHPDDETFSVGGTIARYTRAGIPSTLFCATDGDAGRSSGIVVDSPAALGRLRRAELDAAARTLGLRHVAYAAHPDGKLDAVDGDLLVGQIVDFLREHRPTVVLTFGPEGAPNLHRDHRAISRATTAAFFLAGNPRVPDAVPTSRDLAPWQAARLFYTSWTPPAPGSARTAVAVPATASVDVRDVLDVKRLAFEAHASQHVHRSSFEETLGDHELYALAAGRAQPSPMIDDLFAGLES